MALQFGIRADPRGYTDGCGQVRGHVVHDVCDPSWHTAWHMYRTGCTDVCAKRERSCGPTRTSVPLSGVYVIAWLTRDDRLLISIRNSFFSRSPFGQNSKVKRAQLGVVSGWVTNREVAPGCTRVRTKCAEKTSIDLWGQSRSRQE